MNMSEFNTELFDRAAKFAVDAHSGTERKEKGYPFIIHPMEAATIVASITNDAEMLAAAILHDVVEDTPVTIEDIRAQFGERVARLVSQDTCPLPKDALWRDRKQTQVDLLAAAPHDCKVVAFGDKLSNLRTIAHDYQQIGDKLWERFNAPNGKTDVAWYYRLLAKNLSEFSDTLPYQEFLQLLETVFGETEPDFEQDQ